MPSNTETALAALAAVLTAAAAAGDAFPAPLRNEALPARLAEASEGVDRYLNIWDGDNEIVDETLGSDDMADGYTLTHEADIEWVIRAPDAAIRDTAFDAGIAAIGAAIKADRTLGNVVSDCRLVRVESAQRRLAEDGIANAKGADVIVQLTFLSSGIR